MITVNLTEEEFQQASEAANAYAHRISRESFESTEYRALFEVKTH